MQASKFLLYANCLMNRIAALVLFPNGQAELPRTQNSWSSLQLSSYWWPRTPCHPPQMPGLSKGTNACCFPTLKNKNQWKYVLISAPRESFLPGDCSYAIDTKGKNFKPMNISVPLATVELQLLRVEATGQIECEHAYLLPHLRLNQNNLAQWLCSEIQEHHF